ncbi:SigE family RNA polymerase sigma factor [Aestuariimicrobium soli]|uniref:SigE family RNA polymerase sigma factor n=1 Tax=Aestuariimicrobium soli TaxID=2035834 RepID=UPI003EBCFE51
MTDPTADPGIASFTAYVHAHQRRLVGFAEALCGDRATAEDLVQNAFAKAWLRWGRLSSPGFDTDAYVRRMIVNENNSWWRRAFRRHERTSDAPPERPVHDPDLPDDEVWRALQSLPPRQRAVVALRFLADADVAETAHLLQCSEGTVKSQTSKAMATLRARLPQETS